MEPTWTVVPDNYALKVRGSSDSTAWLAETMDLLGQDDFWNDESLWTTIHASLPNYRLTKFQPLMPDWVQREVLAEHLVDERGARAWLAESQSSGSQAENA